MQSERTRLQLNFAPVRHDVPCNVMVLTVSTVRFRLRAWPSALLALVLGACAPLDEHTPGSAGSLMVEDTLLFAPGSGQVSFQASVDGTLRTVAAGEVDAGGTLRASFPALPPLPARPNVDALLGQPATLPAGVRERHCTPGVPSAPLPAAHLVLLDGGRFQGAGEQGPFVPAPAVIGTSDPEQGQSGVALTRVYVYSDRELSLDLNLDCTYVLQSGGTRPGVMRVRAALRRGWNVLTARVGRPLGERDPIPAVLNTENVRGLIWRYLPQR